MQAWIGSTPPDHTDRTGLSCPWMTKWTDCGASQVVSLLFTQPTAYAGSQVSTGGTGSAFPFDIQ